ncbi:hypothetical protein HMPREF9709_01463 [Helcococcus kunzii ATCC 51366]|uniref:Ribose transport system permease rbsC n=1 Tax=Helcococcus kunzii ATCC 51366 TaxID=883114 RepID=H3NQ52_9FIRM|nr:ABC transporter permease [Helcococcus kunzii]EHR32532.1 hypothetical protein HMPREF9709_01463 [Helcococcus kunzii ATCC 51366]MCT1796363.1 ABC transporter permease [Helcococcus kunzii]MCT1989413.1 ABC transporter permease [Helcococcus kunzii]
MKIKDFFRKFGIYIIVILEVIIFTSTSSNFMTLTNLMNIIRQASIIGIVSVGMTFVILTGGIDLSVGGVIAVSGVIASKLMTSGYPIILACIIAILSSVLVGIVNAYFTHEYNLNSMIVTLATLQVLKGISYLITGGIPIYGFDPKYKIIGQGYLGPVPIPVIIMLSIFLIGFIFLSKTSFGMKVYSIGGNMEASRLSGVDIRKNRYLVFIICSILASIAGLVLLSRVNTAQPDAGFGYEMDVITAVVLGGVAMSGGEGDLAGVLGGVLAIGILSNGMIHLGISEYVQWIAKGLVLLFAVSYDKVIKRKGELRKL